LANVIFSAEYEMIPTFLADLRTRAGLSQRELARRLNKSQSHVHRIEIRQRRIEILEFCNIVRACGGSPVDAFTDLISRLELEA
jgi:transcriptional regulator with XRE-family HTH domain